MRKFIAACSVAVVVGVGGGTAFGLSKNQSATTKVAAPPTTTAAQGQPRGRHRGDDRLSKVLADLVKKGTITQAQADAITSAMAANRPDGHRNPGGMFGGMPGGFKSIADLESTVAGTIGITTDQLRSDMRSGKTIAQIAQEHGVSSNAVVDAVVAKLSALIDQAQAKGQMTADQASKLKAHVQEFVNQFVTSGGFGNHGMHGPMQGHGGWGANPPTMPPASTPPTTNAPAPSTSTAPPSTPAPSNSLPSTSDPATTVPSTTS